MVRGLMSAKWEGDGIVLSPRNAEISRSLESEFRAVSVAKSNQDVIDRAEVVVLALRPQVAAMALEALKFRRDQAVISVIASLSIEQVREISAPAERIMLAAPLPMVETGAGATVIYPDDPITRDIFNLLGRAVPASTPREFNAFVATTAIMGSYFGLIEEMVQWMGRHNVPEHSATQYLSQMFFGLGGALTAKHDQRTKDLRAEFSTKGGLNEQLYDALFKDGAFESLARGLDSIFDRVTRKADE